ncbi:winged helix-turn-helix domain-containing protein [Halobacterium litoreum]|uniref:Helix-turn-helix domain-containing protein n=1 Tax=Halobacterium litoreum TaxID=2039234 RepID=A0ABD5NCL6_9EURY|nr:helix-turn-helix domain-containing protein [Halobacterium litoreum]UHH14176.1 helix-turn-helix domain-containing protein [Halobacterium litoreum]
MSQSQIAVAGRTQTSTDEPTHVTDTESIQSVLDALDDTDCRRILEATREDAMTAGEIADECDLASSTAYRKIDLLADADLLTEELRIRRSGKHVSEYTCAIEDVTLSVATDGGVELSVSHCDTGAESFPALD